MYNNFGQFIDGRWQQAEKKETYDVINPATEEVIGKASKASSVDVQRALKSAEKGLEIWKNTVPWQRAYILRKIADLMRESKIKMDSTIISAETLDDDQSGISSKLDYSKIKNLEAKIDKYRNLLLIDKFNDLNSAKLQTNKIKNLGLIIEEIENKIFVFAGPFNDNNINLKLDFLIKNGYMNAKIYP